MTVTVSLTPQLEKELNRRVRSGQYASASEVVREALRVLSFYEKVRDAQLKKLEREIMVGVQQFEQGEYSEFTEGLLDEIRAAAIKRRKKQTNA